MEDRVFYSLDDINRVLMEKVAAENRKPFEGLTYSRYNLFTTEEKEAFLPLPPSRFEYLERKTAKVGTGFLLYLRQGPLCMPRKYLRQELEIRAGEKEIYVYNKHGDHIRTHKRSYTPKSWVIISLDMPAEYKDYGYWTVPYFQHKASATGPNIRVLIDAVIRKYAYPVQSFRVALVSFVMQKSTRLKLWNVVVKTLFWQANATTPISATRSRPVTKSHCKVWHH